MTITRNPRIAQLTRSLAGYPTDSVSRQTVADEIRRLEAADAQLAAQTADPYDLTTDAYWAAWRLVVDQLQHRGHPSRILDMGMGCIVLAVETDRPGHEVWLGVNENVDDDGPWLNFDSPARCRYAGGQLNLEDTDGGTVGVSERVMLPVCGDDWADIVNALDLAIQALRHAPIVHRFG